MNDFRVAKRYAEALALLGQSDDERNAIGQDLDLACHTMEQNPDLKDIYTGVPVANADKKDVIRKVFSDTISENVLHFLLLLVDKSRTTYLMDIQRAYHAILDEQNGVADATAYSAFPLSDEDAQNLAHALGQAVGKTIRLRTEVDPALLSGVKVKYGDVVIDGSAKAKLERMRTELLKEPKPTEVIN